MKKLKEEKSLTSDERLIHADSGEGGQLDLSPDKEKIDKEVTKELKDRVKYVEDEINNAETPKPEATTSDGKKKGVEGLTKPAKKLKEKLVLEEPSDMLSERLVLKEDDILDEAVNLTEAPVDDVKELVEDYLFNQFSNVIDNIALVLSSKIKGYDADWAAEEPDDDAIYQQITELVGLISDDLFANAGNYDEGLNEAIPKDAIRAYKRHYNPSNTSSSALDYQNSNLTEISPDEALKLITAGQGENIRMLVGNQLVKLNTRNYGDKDFRNQWLDRDKAYTTKKGNTTTDTMHMPAKHLFTIADKIYVADEKYKDQELLQNRAENPESRRSNGNDSFRTFSPVINLNRNSWSGVGDVVRGSGTGYSGTTDSRELRRFVDRNRSSSSNRNNVKDAAARLRYLDSEKDLQAHTKEYYNLKRNLRYNRDELNDAENNLERIKNSGSPEVIHKREQVANLENQLKSIRKQLALLNFELEGADETDAEAIRSAQAKFDRAKDTLDAAEARINQLLGRNR